MTQITDRTALCEGLMSIWRRLPALRAEVEHPHGSSLQWLLGIRQHYVENLMGARDIIDSIIACDPTAMNVACLESMQIDVTREILRVTASRADAAVAGR